MLPEGRWEWFEILAATTLSDREEAVVMTLVDDAGWRPGRKRSMKGRMCIQRC